MVAGLRVLRPGAASPLLALSRWLMKLQVFSCCLPLELLLLSICLYLSLMVLCRFEGAEAGHSIIAAGPEPLQSQFTTSYSLVLNLLSVYSLEEARDFLRYEKIGY
jgi:hypothetical protein